MHLQCASPEERDPFHGPQLKSHIFINSLPPTFHIPISHNMQIFLLNSSHDSRVDILKRKKVQENDTLWECYCNHIGL